MIYVFYLLNSVPLNSVLYFFFFNDTATTEIYTLSLHDALPIFQHYTPRRPQMNKLLVTLIAGTFAVDQRDRKSTRLNSSHANISYAVFCLKKKKNEEQGQRTNE